MKLANYRICVAPKDRTVFTIELDCTLPSAKAVAIDMARMYTPECVSFESIGTTNMDDEIFSGT
jgi:hypothetical protein